MKKKNPGNILKEINGKFKKSSFFIETIDRLRKDKNVYIKNAGRLFTEILSIATYEEGFCPIVLLSQNEDEMPFLKEEITNLSHKKTGLFCSFSDKSAFDMDEIEERILTLNQILSEKLKFIVTNPGALSLHIPPKNILSRNRMNFEKDKQFDFSFLVSKLTEMGFNRVHTVGEVGEFSIRGNIVDIFGFGMEHPRRIEFLDNRIISLRLFDTFSQRTIKKETEFSLLPMKLNFADSEHSTILNYLPETSVFIYSELLFLSDQDVETPELKNRYQIILSNEGKNSEIRQPPEFRGNLPLVKNYFDKIKSNTVYILSESDEETDRCEQLFSEDFPDIVFLTLNLREGLELPELSTYLITDKDIFGKGFHPKVLAKREITLKPEVKSALTQQDYVVHEDYGIGIFENIAKIEYKSQLTECLRLKYEGGDILYVPIGAMSKVSKYIGLNKGNPKLSNLSSIRWEKKKKSARKAIREMTEELLNLYAERKSVEGFAFSTDTIWQKELEASFQYEETEDQLKVINDIKTDMESQKPMDRLICGEVGYGKTELAVRASFKAVMDSKQVILLSPTTVLCEQHYNTFRERLKQFPVVIKMLSRFVGRTQQKEIIRDIIAGKADIVIGTHKLLNKDIIFNNPGLLIIDEEHRFGVAQKEKITKRKKDLDVLSMSATPIPRTLQFSLLNIRDFSTIETPPKGRLSVTTKIVRWKSDLIRKVILSEFRRAGQVFFVHNRIDEISSLLRRLENLIPEAKIAVTHGRMQASIIEKRMSDFLNGRANLLITTTIIESGLDIPNANTIIINRADNYGLAQLHQLRGRVGRSNRRAYCYLVIPNSITQEARKRLSSVYNHSHLGSGLALAMSDLEIRGAGNLLGEKQHGHICNIGYDLYMKLLQETIQKTRGIKDTEKPATEIYSNLPAFLPTSYAEDEKSRIDIYRRLSACDTTAIQQIREELEDRFGKPPFEVQTLLMLTTVKALCSVKYIKKVIVQQNSMELFFSKNRFPSKKNIQSLFENVSRKFFIDYSEGDFKIGFNTSLKKFVSDVKKVLHFLD